MNIPLPCPESDLLRAILRGRIDPDEEDRIAAHLDSCEQCRRTIDLIASADADGEPTVSESQFESEILDESPVILPAGIRSEPLAPELQAVMHQLKEEAPAGRAGSTTESVEGNTRSLPSGMDAFIRQLLDDGKSGQSAMIGHYELGAKIGRGGMGVVYRAYDRKLSRDVAIKFLKPELTRDGTFVERFVREAQAAAGVIHPNVVTVHSIEETKGVPWIVMELIEGESLRSRLRKFGPLTLTSVARIGAQIADGLQAAHEKRLIHRDIKPSNIVLLEGSDEVRITDFGLAQLEGATRLTKSGLLMGTPKYMAPEQARGETIDHRCDLFSLGSVLYAMCTGRAPFPGRNDAEVVSNVAKYQLVPIESVDPTLPRWLTAVIGKLLEPNPEDRFQSAYEVSVLLRRCLDEAEFGSAGSDGFWDENTAVDGSPTFHREAAETLIEGKAPDVAAEKTQVQSTPVTGAAASPAGRFSPVFRSRKTVLAGGLVLLCLLVPVLAGWLNDSAADPVPASSQRNATPTPIPGQGPIDARGILQDFMKPMPEFGDGSVVLVQKEQRRRFRDLSAAVEFAFEGDVILLEFDGEMPIPQIPVRKSITIAAGWNQDQNKPFEPVLCRNEFDIINGSQFLFSIHSPVRLEGIEIHYASAFSEVQRRELPRKQLLEWAIACQDSGKLDLINCRVRMAPGSSTQIAIRADRGTAGVVLRNSEIIGGTAISAASTQRVEIDNSLVLGQNALVILPQLESGGTVEFNNSVFICESLLHFNVGRFARSTQPRWRVRVDAQHNIVDASRSLVTISELGSPPGALTLEEVSDFPLASLLVFGGQSNRYDASRIVTFQNTMAKPDSLAEIPPRTMEDWLTHWRGRDSGSRQADFSPVAGFSGFHPDLLRISGAKELQPRLDGTLPPPDTGWRIERLGPGEGYQNALNRQRDPPGPPTE